MGSDMQRASEYGVSTVNDVGLMADRQALSYRQLGNARRSMRGTPVASGEELARGTLPGLVDFRRRRQTKKIQSFEDLGIAKERALAERIKLGDMEAQQDLIIANLGLVCVIARTYLKTGVSQEDLVQEGNLGLMRASRDFDPVTHGVRFGSYAALWIRSFISRALVRDRSLIRLPRSRRLMERPQLEGTQEHCGNLDEGGGTRARRLNCRGRSRSEPACCGLGRNRKEWNERSVELDELAIESLQPDEILAQAEDSELLARAMTTLSFIEAWVIYHRFGLASLMSKRADSVKRNSSVDQIIRFSDRTPLDDPGGDDELARSNRYYNATYSELGRRLGLSTYRVRQIEQLAVGKLRAYLKSS